MLGKLATLVTMFVLALSTAAFAAPAENLLDFGSETGGAGESELAEQFGEPGQDEIEEIEVYLGPVDSQAEYIPVADDRGVN